MPLGRQRLLHRLEAALCCSGQSAYGGQERSLPPIRPYTDWRSLPAALAYCLSFGELRGRYYPSEHIPEAVLKMLILVFTHFHLRWSQKFAGESKAGFENCTNMSFWDIRSLF